MEEYLKAVIEQIRCKNVRPYVERELRDHLEDQINDNIASGMDKDEAVRAAVKDMGDPIETGIALDRVHRPSIAWGMIALVFVMVSGTVLLSNYLSDDTGIVNQDDPWEFPSQEVSTAEPVSETSSEPVSSEIVSSESVSSEIVSSESVSSEPSVEEELTARYLNKKIKGKWKTDIPYKNMSLPGTFEFDGKGKVKCTIKAFLFSKKFDGSYTIKDGGRCTLTLDGLEEYFEDDTMVGDLKFVTDDKIEFTVDNTVWKLNRVE